MRRSGNKWLMRWNCKWVLPVQKNVVSGHRSLFSFWEHDTQQQKQLYRWCVGDYFAETSCESSGKQAVKRCCHVIVKKTSFYLISATTMTQWLWSLWLTQSCICQLFALPWHLRNVHNKEKHLAVLCQLRISTQLERHSANNVVTWFLHTHTRTAYQGLRCFTKHRLLCWILGLYIIMHNI